jgi:mRNA interferase MazF
VSATYVPDRGDLVYLDFDPQAGHEQRGIRPGLVLSPASFNGTLGFALVCPVTSAVKNYPFEVRIPRGLKCSGVILSDQLKSVDWRARGVRYIDKLPQPELDSVRQKIKAVL